MSVRPKKNKKGILVDGVFVVDWYPDGRNGKRERTEYVGSEAGARDYEMQLKSAGRPALQKYSSPTFLDAIPEFLKQWRNDVAESTVGDFHWSWKRLEPFFKNVQIERLQPEQIEEYKRRRLTDGVKKRTINRELSYLSAIVTWSEDRQLIKPLPFRIRRFRKRDTRSPIPIVHTPQEVQQILDNLNPDRQGLFLLMYDGGLRKSEAFNLEGRQIDLKSLQMRIVGKGNKERLVPIVSKRLLKCLTIAKREQGQGVLFPNPRTKEPYKGIRTALRNAAERAGIDKRIYHHILRHNHGTHSAMSGVDPRAVQKIMGHSNLSTTEIYTHLAGDYLRDQGSKFAALLDQDPAAGKAPKPAKKAVKKACKSERLTTRSQK